MITRTATARTSPTPMITVRSNNQTMGVILPFMSHLLKGFFRRNPELYTVYKIGEGKSMGPRPACFPSFVGGGGGAFAAPRHPGVQAGVCDARGGPPFYSE